MSSMRVPTRLAFAAALFLVAPSTDAATPAACAEGTPWDGISCAHPRATCGAWDGISCDPEPVSAKAEREAAAEMARIDVDARAVCPEEDEARQVYVGTVGEVVRSVDRALGEADRIDRRLETLRDSRPTPPWRVATMGRAGSLYDCIWNGLVRSNPAYFTADQQAKLNWLRAVSVQLGAPRQAVNDLEAAVAAKWWSTRDEYLRMLTHRMVPRYVTAALLARRYALEGFDLTRARRRLPIVARELGKEEMTRILRDTTDPTAPTGNASRHIEYVVGAFD